MTTARLELVAFDAADIEGLASFYTGLTGWRTVRAEHDWITLRAPDGQEVALQLAPDHVPPRWPGQDRPQQFHLDLVVTDHLAAAEHAVALGATRLADSPTYVTLADPAGHPFDLCHRDGFDGPTELHAVTLDAPDAPALARFYAELLDMRIRYEGPEGLFIGGHGRNLKFQPVTGYRAPRWPDPAWPQQAHLDIVVDDLDAGQERALALGAARLPEGGERFRVFADPAGHPFCLTLP